MWTFASLAIPYLERVRLQRTTSYSEECGHNRGGATSSQLSAVAKWLSFREAEMTLHIINGGQVTGMLSVNAYTGAVWYHTWHGAFIASSEA